jgi:hypothetical protein
MLRHLVFHYIIALKAEKMDQKGNTVLLSESFRTLIPNMFVNKYPNEQKDFTDTLGRLLNRDMYVYVKNDLELLIHYKATRDHEIDLEKTRDYIINQRANLDLYVKEKMQKYSICYLEYDYTNDSLQHSFVILEGIIIETT